MNPTDKYELGQKIKFKKDVKPYRIIGKTDRYLVCIKPFNLQKTYLYTVVDLVDKERGPDHWIFGKYNLEDAEDLQLCLDELTSGECKISPRRRIKLDIERVL